MSQALNERLNVAIFTGEQVQEVQERVNEFLLEGDEGAPIFEEDLISVEFSGLSDGRIGVLVTYKYYTK